MAWLIPLRPAHGVGPRRRKGGPNVRSTQKTEATGQELSVYQQYRSLLAVSQMIVSHRDYRTLFHELAGSLLYKWWILIFSLVLHEAATNAVGCTWFWRLPNQSHLGG